MSRNIWNRYVIEVYRDDATLDYFEARLGVDISRAVMEVISLLRRQGRKENYTLIFNNKKLKINYASSRKQVIKEYFKEDDSSCLE